MLKSVEIGFSPQNEPQSAKLSFTSILKHFRGNWTKKHIVKSLNLLSQKEASNNLELIIYQII